MSLPVTVNARYKEGRTPLLVEGPFVDNHSHAGIGIACRQYAWHLLTRTFPVARDRHNPIALLKMYEAPRLIELSVGW